MKRVLFVIGLLFCIILIHAQTVAYTYKPLAAEGCSVEYTPSWQEGKPFLIVSVHSDRMKFVENPVLLFKTNNGETIKLEGRPLETYSSSSGIVSGNMVIPIQGFITTAQFPITEEQIDQLGQGIIKVRISLIPINHERTFKKDKIGKKLFNAFYESKINNDDF